MRYEISDPYVRWLPLDDYRRLYHLQVRDLKDYAMFLLDPQGILRTWNLGVQRLLGYSEEEWIGQPAAIIFVPEENAAELCAAEMQLAVEKGVASDVRWHCKKDGTQLFAHGSMTAIFDSSGELLGFRKILSDETSRKRLENALMESNAALEEFASMTSHDLQEPLRSIQSYATLLKRRAGEKLDTEEQEVLECISRSARQMSSLVQDLLRYSRLTAEKESAQAISLDHPVETAISQLYPTLEEIDAQITHDPLPAVSAIQSQMVRLFLNLFSNSVRYRKPHVPLRVHVAAEQKDSVWQISVSDNGQGFDPKYADLIFKPFQRLKSKEESGSGLGLSICRRIVEAHHGCIWAAAEPDQGATFFFTLPAVPETS